MLYRLAELEDILAAGPGLFVRYSHGYAADLEAGSVDPETGLELPGLAAVPLDPERWWTRPAAEWLARRLSGYLRDVMPGEEGFAWVMRGRIVGHSASGEPLVTEVELVGRLADCLLDEAEHVYHDRFADGPSDAEDDRAALAHA